MRGSPSHSNGIILQELRDRKVYTYANNIQRFFLRFALQRHFWELQMNGNRVIQGKKERRRLSLEVDSSTFNSYCILLLNHHGSALSAETTATIERISPSKILSRDMGVKRFFLPMFVPNTSRAHPRRCGDHSCRCCSRIFDF